MLRKLEIDNFKTMNHFKTELNPMTVFVGNNAAGKSTVLQAISLLAGSVREDFSAILSVRNWNVADLRSKCRPKTGLKMGLAVELDLTVGQVSRKLRWEMVLQYVIQKNSLLLLEETIKDLDDKQMLMEYTNKGTILYKKNREEVSYPRLSGDSSMLKLVIDVERDKEAFPELVAVKQFFIGVQSFELLSPEQMRMSSRGKETKLSISGRNLPTFLKNMPEKHKKHFQDNLKKLLGEWIAGVSTETKGTPGWTYVNVEEKFDLNSYQISSRHLSDGMLRLLAFVGIAEVDDGRLMMLDEIENGINSSYAEPLMEIFREMSEGGIQLILTTHSVAFLDYVNQNDIVYLYRDIKDGSTVAARIFDIPEVRERLEYMYPGEIIYNLDNQKLVELCLRYR